MVETTTVATVPLSEEEHEKHWVSHPMWSLQLFAPSCELLFESMLEGCS